MVNVWYTMVYLSQNTMVFYHGFPVSKHHGLPWFPWYLIVFYHGLPVSKHHGIYNGIRTMVYFHRGEGGRYVNN